MEDVFFSIVIPLYNKEQSIQKTISSVLRQSYSKWELIIVNDGSTDDSMKVASSISDSRIRFVNKKNGGVCSARNRGILEAKYDYVAFLDADDVWYPSYLEKQSEMIEDFPQAAMWGTNFYETKNGVRSELDTGFTDDFRGYVYHYFKNRSVSDLFISSSIVIKKNAFTNAGVFDERIKYSEDLDMWYRLILNYPVAFSAQHLVEYVQDSENRAMERKIALMDFLPFYVDKYDEYCDHNKDFSYFIHTFTAANLREYYFGTKEERRQAKIVVKKIRYQDIHPKYRLWYTPPYIIGYFFYHMTVLKHKILS